MKINCKQTIVKFPLADRIILALLTVLMFFFISSSVSFAPTRLMSDSELSNVEGQALFQISNLGDTGTGSANVIKIDLGIDLNMFAHMDSFRMGYYTNADGNNGWDVDTTNYYWGSSDLTSTPLVFKGLFLELGFDNISNNATRTLNYLDIGTSSASGTIMGTLNTLNGMIATSGTGQNGGVLLRQTASGTRTVSFNNWMLSFVFATKYTYHSSSGLHGIFIKIPNYTTS